MSEQDQQDRKAQALETFEECVIALVEDTMMAWFGEEHTNLQTDIDGTRTDDSYRNGLLSLVAYYDALMAITNQPAARETT